MRYICIFLILYDKKAWQYRNNDTPFDSNRRYPGYTALLRFGRNVVLSIFNTKSMLHWPLQQMP